MDPRTSWVTSGRASLAVTEWDAPGPAILALHPGVADSRIWTRCGPTWAAAGNRVVAYDRRGFGSTTYVPESHDDLDDLLAVSAATASWPAILVGNSRGGGLALDLALAHPEHVSAMILLAPSPSGYDYEDWPTSKAEAEQDELIVAADSSGDVELVNRLEARYWLDGVEQAEGRVGGDGRALFIDMNGAALRADPIGESSSRVPAWPLLTQISVPTLVIVGEFDLPGIHGQCGELARLLPAGHLVTIPGSAHCPQLDQPELLDRAVLDFVKSLQA